jgi:hypothetical protein
MKSRQKKRRRSRSKAKKKIKEVMVRKQREDGNMNLDDFGRPRFIRYGCNVPKSFI